MDGWGLKIVKAKGHFYCYVCFLCHLYSLLKFFEWQFPNNTVELILFFLLLFICPRDAQSGAETLFLCLEAVTPIKPRLLWVFKTLYYPYYY